jgi:purine-nucleoside phosphorylase
MLERMGADAVCMSTAAEVAMAAALGVPVAGISCVTNWAAGRSPRKLSHAEVVGAVQAVAPALKQLLERLILALA